MARIYRVRFSAGPIYWEGHLGIGSDTGWALVEIDDGRITRVLDGKGVMGWDDKKLYAQLDLGEFGVESTEIKLEIDGDTIVGAKAGIHDWVVTWREELIPHWEERAGCRMLIWSDGQITQVCCGEECAAVDAHINYM